MGCAKSLPNYAERVGDFSNNERRRDSRADWMHWLNAMIGTKLELIIGN